MAVVVATRWADGVPVLLVTPAVAPPLLKRPAAVKRPAVAVFFDIDAFASDLLSREEALDEPRRGPYIEKLRKRAFRAAIRRGMSKDDACAVRTETIKRARLFHIEVHQG